MINKLSITLMLNFVFFTQKIFSQSAPPEFYQLANLLSGPFLYNSSEFRNQKVNFEKAYKESTVLLNKIELMDSQDQTISRSISLAKQGALDIVAGAELLSKIPTPPSELDSVLGAFILGMLSDDAAQGAISGAQVGAEGARKRNEYSNIINSVNSGASKIDAAGSLLMEAAKKYGANEQENKGRIACDINEQWQGFSPPDWVMLYNSGETIENVAIDLKLIGTKDTCSNFYFTKKWNKESWLYFPCQGKSTVESIRKAEILLISEAFSTSFDYIYEGENRDIDVSRTLKDVELFAKYRPYEKGIIFDNQRGIVFSFSGHPFFVNAKVYVTFKKKNGESQTLYWKIDTLKQRNQSVFASEKFTFDPDFIDVRIIFEGTKARCQKTFNLR